MITSFKELKNLTDSPFVMEIVEHLRNKNVEEIQREKFESIEKLKVLLDKSEWSKEEKNFAIEAAIKIAGTRFILDNGKNSKIGHLEKNITEVVKPIINDYHNILHPTFVYTEFMTNEQKVIETARKNHAEISAKRNSLIEKIRNDHPAEYLRLVPMLSELNRLLKISAMDEAREKEDLNLINTVATKLNVRLK
jgi:hypothetical protein